MLPDLPDLEHQQGFLPDAKVESSDGVLNSVNVI